MLPSEANGLKWGGVSL